MIASPASPDRQGGFTLLDLLVAIALFSLLSLVLTSSLQFGFVAWARGADHAERIDQHVLAEEFLRRTLGDAYPYFTSTDPTRGGGQVEFSGTATSIAFLASAPAAGMRTLYASGAAKAWTGETTIEEVLRATRAA
jgi:general secretion pathway protein J